MGADPAVRVSVPAEWAEIAGAVLFDLLGSFQEFSESGYHHMLFFPFRHGVGYVDDGEIAAALPSDPDLQAGLQIERILVPGGWEEGWKEHFKPITIGALYIRPPWEGPPSAGSRLHDVVLNPGLAFGTGLHPTTRGVLTLLQDRPAAGRVVDAGTGSGILAISAAKLGFGPVTAFDDDPLAVAAARTNSSENGVEVEVGHHDLGEAPAPWFDAATVLANITLDPVLRLLDRLEALGLRLDRLLISGILAGEQEGRVIAEADRLGLDPARRVYEAEWVSIDLRPSA
jgi:ribosomal protein L11 methyltransferase